MGRTIGFLSRLPSRALSCLRYAGRKLRLGTMAMCPINRRHDRHDLSRRIDSYIVYSRWACEITKSIAFLL